MHLFYILFTKQINPNFTLIGEGFGFIFLFKYFKYILDKGGVLCCLCDFGCTFTLPFVIELVDFLKNLCYIKIVIENLRGLLC